MKKVEKNTRRTRIFSHCFHHLPLYPLETQQILNISSHDNNVIIFFKNKNAEYAVMNLCFYTHFLFFSYFLKHPSLF